MQIVPKQGPSSAATRALLRRLKQGIAADMSAGTVPSTMAALAARLSWRGRRC